MLNLIPTIVQTVLELRLWRLMSLISAKLARCALSDLHLEFLKQRRLNPALTGSGDMKGLFRRDNRFKGCIAGPCAYAISEWPRYDLLYRPVALQSEKLSPESLTLGLSDNLALKQKFRNGKPRKLISNWSKNTELFSYLDMVQKHRSFFVCAACVPPMENQGQM